MQCFWRIALKSQLFLARALVARSQIESATASKPTVVAIAAQEREAIATAALNQRIFNMETRLGKVQNNMEARLGDVTGMLGRILAAVCCTSG